MATKSRSERSKYGWLHTFPCCLSGRHDVEVSHLHERMWSGIGRKVSFVYTLPMAAPLHRAQHKYPRSFWADAGFPHETDNDPRIWAERLHDLWELNDLEGATALLWDMQDRANRDFLAQFLGAGNGIRRAVEAGGG